MAKYDPDKMQYTADPGTVIAETGEARIKGKFARLIATQQTRISWKAKKNMEIYACEIDDNTTDKLPGKTIILQKYSKGSDIFMRMAITKTADMFFYEAFVLKLHPDYINMYRYKFV